MKIAAIIAEYNPFHNGHKYLIEETRRLTGADYILAIMSGDFVQRGAPAICNKYLRTKMALSGGADAVIELPSIYALSSAEFFASGSVSVLNCLGCIDLLAFGSESGELSHINDAADLLCQNTLNDSAKLSAYMKAGMSYPAARSKLLQQNFAADQLFSSPNNILGVEYCKALKLSGSNISPFTIKRTGSNYHSKELLTDSSQYGSASAIRNVIEKDIGSKTALPSISNEIKNHVPSAVYDIMTKYNITETYLTSDDFSNLLHYKLLSEQSYGFSKYLDCSQALSDKICKHLPEFTTVSDFILRLKSKELTYTRISRVLFHILLNITTPEWYDTFSDTHTLHTPYARLLGFHERALPMLSHIRKNSSIPIIAKLADASSYLDSEAYQLLSQDIFCASVYETVHFHKTEQPALNEFKQSPIKIS